MVAVRNSPHGSDRRVHVSLFQRLGGNSKSKAHFWFLAVAFLLSVKTPVFPKHACLTFLALLWRLGEGEGEGGREEVRTSREVGCFLLTFYKVSSLRRLGTQPYDLA